MLKTLCLTAFIPVLAQMSSNGSSDPTSWQSMGWIVAAIFGLVGLANQGLELWNKLFLKTPPDHEHYATKKELANVLAEMSELEKDHENEMARMEKRFEKWMQDFHSEMREEHKEAAKFRELVANTLGRHEAQLAKPKR